MNTHLDVGPEHGRKLAETLRCLSLEPSLSLESISQSPKQLARRLVLPIGLAALVAGSVVGIAVHRTGAAHSKGEIVAAVPGEMQLPQGARMGERSTSQNLVSAAREIAGSGFVISPRMTTVFSKYEGRIVFIAVAPGDTVKAGDILVTIEDAGTPFALEQARTTNAQAELVLAARIIDLAQARASLDRIENLAGRGTASQHTLDDARTAMEQASNAVAQAGQSVASADLSIRIAKERQSELTVRAPLAGTVTRLDAHVGDTVLARSDSVRESQGLLTIADMTSMVIDADIAETNTAALKPGQHGEAVLDGFPDRPFGVVVQRLAPVASAEKGTIAIRLSLADPPFGIRPNMAARIRLPLNKTEGITP